MSFAELVLTPQFLAPLAAVAVLALLFANAEIQIEGRAGWAANLPTWRIEEHWLLDIFWGGRPMTGYHLWVFSFIGFVFHFPLFFAAQWSLPLEARIAACVMFFWILEDYLWFVINPAYGWRRFKREYVPWHKRWLLGAPIDYWMFGALGAVLYRFSF